MAVISTAHCSLTESAHTHCSLSQVTVLSTRSHAAHLKWLVAYIYIYTACMCRYVCLFLCVCAHMCLRQCVLVCLCVCVCVRTHASLCVCVCARMHVCACAQVCLFICVPISCPTGGWSRGRAWKELVMNATMEIKRRLYTFCILPSPQPPPSTILHALFQCR